LPKVLTSAYDLRSKSLHDESSEPVPNAFPLGKKCTELISDSCPVNVWMHLPVRQSHTLAVESHDPDTNMFSSVGEMDTDMTSPPWSLKVTFASPRSTSQWMQVESPELVIIEFSSTKRQHER
jgi:hypothetical protein